MNTVKKPRLVVMNEQSLKSNLSEMPSRYELASLLGPSEETVKMNSRIAGSIIKYLRRFASHA